MVRILTPDFNELDLTPGFEFQVEMTNPMLDTGHLPEAFSTQISFPPSPNNREKFGYTPVLMRPPSVQRLAASIWIGGVPFMYGTLVYDGIEDGALLYTFTGKIPDLESKIWDQELLEFTTNNLPAPDSSLYMTPLVIRKNNVAMQPYLKGAVDPNLWVKYWNYKTEGKSFDYNSFLPAIPVSAIISWLGLKTPPELTYLLNTICVLGRYHEFAGGDIVAGSENSSRPNQRTTATSTSASPSPNRGARGESSYSGQSSGNASAGRGTSDTRGTLLTDLASFLPDITFADLLRGIGSMLCCSFFMEGGTLRMVGNGDILITDPLDWRGKVSDKFSAEIQPAATYKFGYGDSDADSEKPYLDPRSTHKVEAGANGTFDPNIILAAIANTGQYSVVYDKTTGDIYSGRSYEFGQDGTGKPSGYSGPNLYDCDVVYHDAKPVSLEVDDEDSESFDCSCQFKLVRCVPEKIFPTSGAGMWPTDSAATFRMTPVVEAATVSEGRDSDVYIGIIDNLYGQMTDHDQFLPKIELERAALGTRSLTPADLFDRRHQIFAEWMARRRQVVKTAVNLTPSELHSFRMYKPVYFAGRKWIVKRLSVTAGAATDTIDVDGDFVEV